MEGFDPEKEVDSALTEAGEPILSEDDVGKIDEQAAQTAEAQQTEAPAGTGGESEAIDSAIKEADKATEEEAPKSFLVDTPSEDEEGIVIPDEEKRTGRYVPVEDHAKLRQRAQDAEAEVEKLRTTQSGTGTTPEKSGEAEEDLENYDEDDIITKAQAQEIAKTEFNRLEDIKAQQLITKDQEAQQRQAARQVILDGETQARKDLSDYDAVCAAGLGSGAVTKGDMQNVMSAKNPAVALYIACKQKVSALGISPSPTNEEVTSEKTDDEPTDEDMIVQDDESFMNETFSNQTFK